MSKAYQKWVSIKKNGITGLRIKVLTSKADPQIDGILVILEERRKEN
jgi:hypothetical protein